MKRRECLASDLFLSWPIRHFIRENQTAGSGMAAAAGIMNFDGMTRKLAAGMAGRQRRDD